MTKFLTFAPALATLALVASVGAAAAENAFTFDRAQSTAASVALTNVEAERAGTIQVYADNGDNGFGRNLGSARIGAGVTGDLAIALREPFDGDLAIVMMGPDHWVSQMSTRPGLAKEATAGGADCVVTSADGQVVHDSRGDVVTC